MDEAVIVQVGGEGGGITLFGRLSNEQWEFRRSSSDASLALTDEEQASRPMPDPVWVKTWAEGMALLDRNPWAKLVPIAVHVDFREEVLFEVTRRLLADPSHRNEGQMERWLQICSARQLRFESPLSVRFKI